MKLTRREFLKLGGLAFPLVILPNHFLFSVDTPQREIMRGVNISPWLSEDDLKPLADWRVNAVRLQLTKVMEEPFKLSDDNLKQLDNFVNTSEKYRMKPIINVAHEKQNEWLQSHPDSLREFWEMIAKRYKGRGIITDLFNEPYPTLSDGTLFDWNSVARELTKTIRKIDPKLTVIVQSYYGHADAFRGLVPTGDKNTFYSVHFDYPKEFTNQGIGEPQPDPPVTYPGYAKRFREDSQREWWDKEKLRKELEKVVEFQKKYNAQIMVGEFSAVRWAPGAYEYLRDLLEILEEYDFSWTYASYGQEISTIDGKLTYPWTDWDDKTNYRWLGGWDGWSPRHGSKRSDHNLTEANDRSVLLKSHFQRNKR